MFLRFHSKIITIIIKLMTRKHKINPVRAKIFGTFCHSGFYFKVRNRCWRLQGRLNNQRAKKAHICLLSVRMIGNNNREKSIFVRSTCLYQFSNFTFSFFLFNIIIVITFFVCFLLECRLMNFLYRMTSTIICFEAWMMNFVIWLV